MDLQKIGKIIDTLVIGCEEGGYKDMVTLLEELRSETGAPKETPFISHVKVTIPIKYGDEDVGYTFPLRKGNTWEATINLKTHKIEEWPKDKDGHYLLSAKVVNEGLYQLITSDGCAIGCNNPCNGYVPHNLIPGEYGGYISLYIVGGVVTNMPDINDVDLSNFLNKE